MERWDRSAATKVEERRDELESLMPQASNYVRGLSDDLPLGRKLDLLEAWFLEAGVELDEPEKDFFRVMLQATGRLEGLNLPL